MANEAKLPIILIISNGLGGWPEFRKILAGKADIRIQSAGRNYDDINKAFKDGPPVVIGMGCVANGELEPAGYFAGLAQSFREDAGYTGKILGLCDFCYQQHMAVGCDEVHQFGRVAALRILELI